MLRTDDCIGRTLLRRFADNRERLADPGFNESQSFFLPRRRYSAEYFRGGDSIDQLRRRIVFTRESAEQNLQVKELIVDLIADMELLLDIVKQLSCPVKGI